MFAAGKLNQRVTFQQKTASSNAIGEDVGAFADVCTVWAEARPLRGREFFTANQMQHAVDVRFIIRERAGLSSDMRVIWKGNPYDITGLIPGTGPYIGFLEITAVNGVRNGRQI